MRGLRARLYQIRNYLIQSTCPPDILCLQETFLKDKHQTPKFNNYNVIRQDFTKHSRGGLAILVKNGISFTLLNVDQIENAEILGIQIKTENGQLQILNTYIAPDLKITKIHMEKLFRYNKAIILGDFNAHSKSWGCTKDNERGPILEEILNDSQLTVLNTGQPTRIPPVNSKNRSVIDLAIVTRELSLKCHHYVTNNSMGSDHYLCNTIINEEVQIEPNMSMHLWKLRKTDWKEFKNNSQYVITEDLIGDDNNVTFKNIVDSLTALANDTLPCKNKNHNVLGGNKKHKPLPYWNNKCTEAVYKRNKARNKATKTRDLKDFVEYKHQEAVVKVTLKAEAKSCWEAYCSDLTDQTKLGVVWNMARRMNCTASFNSIPTLNSNGLLADTNIEKSNLLAQIYANTSSSTNYSPEFAKRSKFNPKPSNVLPSLDDIDALNESFSYKELKDAICNSKCGKSPGNDKIPYEFFKHLHKHALKILLLFYNKIWTESEIPSDWQHAIILPVLKPNKSPGSPDSYRPISLTSTMCKIMEKLVTNRLQWFVEKNNLLSKNQSGFRKNKSTIDQILKLQDTIMKKMKNKEDVLAIFIDFERAYDMLHVPTLLKKLSNMGICGKTYEWILQFLSNRTFQVKVGSSFSDKYILENGTPQGSVISPLLFLIMINDIPQGLDGVEMTLFADDSSIYAGHRNHKRLENIIQNSINTIKEWCNKNGFKISTSKTVGVLFTKKRRIPNIKIKLGKDSVKIEKKAKFLGVIFDCRLSWKQHIEYVITKCKNRMNLMRAVSGNHWGASKKALLNIYRALIRSVIDYGNVVYASAPKSYLDKLSSIQTQALKLCCGAAKGTAAMALQNECGELPIELRRLQNSLKLGTKILGTENHPVGFAFHPHWTNEFRTLGHKDETTYTRTHSFYSSLDIPFQAPSFSKTPPWLNKHIQVDMSLHKEISKKGDNPEFIKLLSLDHMSRYQTYTHIYTDGSKAGKTVAAAYTIPTLSIDMQFRLCDNSSVYAAELTAIKEVFSWISKNENQESRRFAVFSDSLSVLTSIKKCFSDSRPTLLQDTIRTFNQITLSEVCLVWIPSHVNIVGNERADMLAKQSLSKPIINSTSYLELKEVFSLIKSYVVDEWQRNYNSDTKGHHYKSIVPMVDTNIKFHDLNRKKEVQISRLRLGKVNLNERLHFMKRHANGLCNLCKVTESVNHLLLACRKEDICNRLRDICIVYKSEFNLKSLLGIGCMQSEVYRIVNQIYKGKIV
jgi:ribonuclease HI